MPVNMSVSELPVTVLYSPISFGKLRLWIQFTGALHTLKLMGFTNKDIDELKGIFADTNIILLCGTFVVAALHVSITLSLFFCGSYKISLRFLNFPVGKDFKTSKIFYQALQICFVWEDSEILLLNYEMWKQAWNMISNEYDFKSVVTISGFVCQI